MPDVTRLLGDLSVEQFLAEYWQKRPLLIRQALPGYTCPVSPDELAGLACEEEVESRLIMEKDGATPWQVEHGPFPESRFSDLPATHWTLLVQEINKHVPDFALLQERFAFIPNWRLDDVMVSYAPDQGTVGPHADNYDVFLIQGLGRRRWQVNERAPAPDELIPGLPLRIMRTFEPQQEWVLEPGDMLYLPPGVAHYGVALGECITISVGFRAPNWYELRRDYFDDRLAGSDTEIFYADPDLHAQENPGELAESARQKVRTALRALVEDDAGIDRWLGGWLTEPRPGHTIPEPEERLEPTQLLARLEAAGEIWRSEYCRFTFIPCW